MNKSKNIKAGIIGGAGYTGGELIRLLLTHPHAHLEFVHSKSNAGKPVQSVHQDLLGDTDLNFTDQLKESVDILFLCVGHGEAKNFLQETEINSKTRIIDLSNDFRLKENSSIGKRKFVYGLPELNREEIRVAHNVANPGCFATCIQLGLLPLAQLGLLDEVYTTGITGSTGAGQSLSSTSHFSWRANNIQAYKTLSHQHLLEIGESLQHLQKKRKSIINFVPWRGDFTRGIFVSSQLNSEMSISELNKLYESFYADHPFTRLSKDPIFLKQVINTNKCIIQLEKVGSKLVIHSITDNLLKGASGQAVQNMNLMFGLDECAGLNLKSIGF